MDEEKTDKSPAAASEEILTGNESLEGTLTAESASGSDEDGVISAESPNTPPTDQPPQPPKGQGVFNRLLGFNIYLVLFICLLVIAGAVIFVTYVSSKKKTSSGIATASLSDSTLSQLANSDATVGSNGQVLNVQSSAVFAGKVLARSDLEVAGNLQLGGSFNVPTLTVGNTANINQLQIGKNLSVSGNSAIQGQETIGQNLQVGGNGNFGGKVTASQLNTNGLQLNGDLNLTHHITAGGGTPGRSSGTALGSGGTTSVGGSDTAGSVSINTGSNPNAGCFITINFTAKYNSTPHVLITPVGASAAGISYYVNRSASSFSICTVSTPPANAAFGFDYFVLD